jgi:predicted TPR repeat methyltransferase
MSIVLVDRVSYLVEACHRKRVLHLGCTDWPYTEQKLASGSLLHARISSVASSLVGVDADPQGVACFRQMGFPETYVENVENFSSPLVKDRAYDVIVAGEILEHLENCGLFLRSVQNLMGPRTELIITTINAYCFFRFVSYLFGRENVHPDHNYYFSPVVLRKLLNRCGLEVVEFCHYPIGKEHRLLNPRRVIWLDDLGRTLFPRASDGVIFKARLPQPLA